VPPSARNVARVVVDVPHPHLDRLFDYEVPPELEHRAQPGVRVRVRFAGRRVTGYVVDRVEQSAHTGPLAPLDVVSDEVVLTGAVAGSCRAVADHYAGTLTDVIRLAVPPRHARTEREDRPVASPAACAPPEAGEWARYAEGPALLDALAGTARPRVALCVLPGADWADLLARAALATAAGGRGSTVVLPDVRDVARMDAALRALAGAGHHVVLHADLGPARRYRAFLAAVRGRVPVVVGTRSAVFAPVHHLGLVVVWDDGDDLHAEPRAPYPHARDVALIRAHHEGAGVLLAGHARTAETARLVRTGWASDLSAPRAQVRLASPLVRAAGDAEGRLPRAAFTVAREALAVGPVLVQVPRSGYRPATACARCRASARCSTCQGPVAEVADAPPRCSWCGASALGWVCPTCGGRRLRGVVVGSERTADELGRAFPGVPVRRSGHGHVLDEVPDEPSIVVATPGAEPRAPHGYCAALLLDGLMLLQRADLRAGEEAVRRWMAAAALVRPAAQGGQVVLAAPSAHRAVQAVVRWDPARAAEAELADREAAGLPPAVRVAELTGEPADVDELLLLAALPAAADVLGPVVVDGASRALVRAPLSEGAGMTAALRAASAVRSARRSGAPVRVRVDPVVLG
jgi:primosomal protein N' (replication factor Y)